uniref:Acetyl-CoA acetyltransferase n=1 Tax=Spongospora subterranea TaxID=70186 RepID=A0A0H5RA46_9EUKA|eukprot:CRZ10958.1 hypothetical protein [Spongospora subterranea]
MAIRLTTLSRQLTTTMSDHVCIVAAVRTPLGCLGGALSSLSAVQLGAAAIQDALKRSGVSPDLVDEVFLGNVLSAGVGQAPARQAALAAGIPSKVPCTTVNKVCASGMKATTLGAQSIMLGHNDIVVVGGMESMSNCPYYIPSARFGMKYGHGKLIDGVQHDGLWDPYIDAAMGECGDICAREYNISREEQDQVAAESYKRAAAATKSGLFKEEIVGIVVKGRKGDTVVDQDEQISKVDFAKISQLRPVFSKDGSVTAANASPISDGAAALVLVSKKKAMELNLKVIAYIRSFADAAQDPVKFTTSPALAVPKALAYAGLDKAQIDLFEFNEAFAVVGAVNTKLLQLDANKVNVLGGAVALGHPLGCSGARIIVTLLSALKHRSGRLGCAAICNGGGGASSIIIELA